MNKLRKLSWPEIEPKSAFIRFENCKYCKNTVRFVFYSGSPADRAGLCAGDEILEINGLCMTNASYNEIIEHIRQVRLNLFVINLLNHKLASKRTNMPKLCFCPF